VQTKHHHPLSCQNPPKDKNPPRALIETDMGPPRFSASIHSGDLEITSISMHQEGDGAQKLALFKRPAEKVLLELISHRQHGSWSGSLA
jgi:hypothetical protein